MNFDASSGELEYEPACADCGVYTTLIGPMSFDGDYMEQGDFVCAECAESRGFGFEPSDFASKSGGSE